MSSPDRLAALERELQLVSALGTVFNERAAAISGINCSDLECLGLIETGRATSAGELAVAAGLSTGAITGVLDRLEQAGYLRREPDPDDRRRIRLVVLERAAEIRNLFRPLIEDLHRLWSEYDDATLDRVTEVLARSRRVAESHVADLDARVEALQPDRPVLRARRR